MPSAETCKLWNDPEIIRLKGALQLVETYEDSSHSARWLLACPECGQLYFGEFHEEIDWNGGPDAMYNTYFPIRDAAHLATLKSTGNHFDLMHFVPTLQWDDPGNKPATVRWVR